MTALNTNALTALPVVPEVDGELITPAALMAGAVDPELASRPLSVFDLMRVGIGPSSSHTVGPMRAGAAFGAALVRNLERRRQAAQAGAASLSGAPAQDPQASAPAQDPQASVPAQSAQETQDTALPQVTRLTVELYGSLGATGRGHATDRAVVMGLGGYNPKTVPQEVCANFWDQVEAQGYVQMPGLGQVPFSTSKDIMFLPGRVLSYHVNGMTLTAYDAAGAEILRRTYFSVGGGFVMEDVGSDGHPEIRALATAETKEVSATLAPYPFSSANELLAICRRTGLRISDVVLANEVSARTEQEVIDYIRLLETTMMQCIEAGCKAQGVLPGVLGVHRRANALYQRLLAEEKTPADAYCRRDPLRGMDWVNLYALAVNEENAAGHRVVTAPTNGSAGIMPAVLAYYRHFCPGANDDGVRRFMLAATAVGALIKTNASIAGAEVGCQGEVGSASSMAAAGLTEALGGTPEQVENAAEIAMEHNLGLTCDPVGGLVQIPCIERNAVASVKAINASRMALWGEGRHQVSLDTVIETMRQTGEDMLSKYKETSLGGLAVNVVEC